MQAQHIAHRAGMLRGLNKFARQARHQPAISTEMQVHNSSCVTFHNCNVITVAESVPQNCKISKTYMFDR